MPVPLIAQETGSSRHSEQGAGRQCSAEGSYAGLSDDDLTVDLSDRLDEFSFLLVGDTGAGDRSQYALVPPLPARGAET